MKLKELFAKTQGSRQLCIAGQKEKAMCGRDFWGRYRNTEAWETEVSKVNLIPARATIGGLWFDTVICEIELAAPQGTAQEPPQDGQKPATLGPGMVFQNGRAHVQDGPITVNLGQGAYFRMENTPASAPCDPPDGVTVEVWDRLKDLCGFCKEVSKRGGIWAARSWGIDAAALEFVIDWIEGTQAAQEAAQDAPGTMEPPQVNDACQLVRAFVEGRMRVPSGTVLNITLKAGDDGVCVKTTPDKPQEAD